MDKKMLDIVACPKCQGSLVYDKSSQELICETDALAYPIKDDIPVLIISQARNMNECAQDDNAL